MPMDAVAAVTGDVWPPTHGRCTRVAGVLCALCRCGRTLITHLPHNTASHPPKQHPLQVQGTKIGPSCCAFSVLSCLQSEGKIMVIMPKFSFGRGSAPHPAGAPSQTPAAGWGSAPDPAGLPPWTHNFCTFASCPRPPSLLQLWEHFCKNTLKTPSTSAYSPPVGGGNRAGAHCRMPHRATALRTTRSGKN